MSAEAGETHRIGLTQVIPAETQDGRKVVVLRLGHAPVEGTPKDATAQFEVVFFADEALALADALREAAGDFTAGMNSDF